MVLCAYLGQLAKVRDALSDSVAVIIDERDQEALAAGEEDKEIQEESLVEHVQVSKRVSPTFRTGYQCYLCFLGAPSNSRQLSRRRG